MSTSSHTHVPQACLRGEVRSDLPPGFKLGLLCSCCSLGILCGCKFSIIIIVYSWLCGAALIVKHGLQRTGLSGCGTQAQLLQGMWDPPHWGRSACPLRSQLGSLPLSHPGRLCVQIPYQMILLPEHLLPACDLSFHPFSMFFTELLLLLLSHFSRVRLYATP